MKPKLTGLYPPSVNPVRVGVYVVEFSYSEKRHFSFWSGEFWGCVSYNRDFAGNRNLKSGMVYGACFAA